MDGEKTQSAVPRPDFVRCTWAGRELRFPRRDFDAACAHVCRVFKLDVLKPQQIQTLAALFDGRDVLALLPTGFGKTIAFTALVVVYDFLLNGDPSSQARTATENDTFCRPILIIVSPLTQLILRQVKDFNDAMVAGDCKWLNAVCAYSSDGQIDETKHKLIYGGRPNVYFFSPGHLTGAGRFRALLSTKAFASRVVALIIDEVHCVQLWGVDFRKEYQMLSSCRSLLGYSVPCGGFTATLTPEDQTAVAASLCLTDTVLIQASPDRPNIFLRCEPFDHRIDEPALFDAIISELKEHKQASRKLLIYCKSKSRAQDYWSYVQGAIQDSTRGPHLLVNMVSGDLSPAQVKSVTDAFMDVDSPLRVLFSSEVLGMGIDIKGLYRVWVIGQFGTLKEYVISLLPSAVSIL